VKSRCTLAVMCPRPFDEQTFLQQPARTVAFAAGCRTNHSRIRCVNLGWDDPRSADRESHRVGRQSAGASESIARLPPICVPRLPAHLRDSIAGKRETRYLKAQHAYAGRRGPGWPIRSRCCSGLLRPCNPCRCRCGRGLVLPGLLADHRIPKQRVSLADDRRPRPRPRPRRRVSRRPSAASLTTRRGRRFSPEAAPRLRFPKLCTSTLCWCRAGPACRERDFATVGAASRCRPRLEDPNAGPSR